MKKCKICGVEKPATAVYFAADKACKNGITGKCRECRNKIGKIYYGENKEKSIEYGKKRHQENKEKDAEYQRLYSLRTIDLKEKYRDDNKERFTEYRKKFYRDNKDKIAMRAKRYGIDNRESLAKYRSMYYKAHVDKIAQYQKEYVRANSDKVKVLNQRRRSRKAQLPTTMTSEQWNNAKQYFDNKCAYCGKEKPLAQEHFIPLSKGGEYSNNNIIPSCKSCNSTKSDKLFADWYCKTEQYSKKREIKILKYLNYSNGIQQLSFT